MLRDGGKLCEMRTLYLAWRYAVIDEDFEVIDVPQLQELSGVTVVMDGVDFEIIASLR